MNLENLKEYLEGVKIIQNVNIIITDMEKVIYCNPSKDKEKKEITNKLKKFIMNCSDKVSENENIFNLGELGKKTIDIIKNEKSSEQYTGQMIVALQKEGKRIGSLIFYRDESMEYGKRPFVKSKLKSIEITKEFLEKFI